LDGLLRLLLYVPLPSRACTCRWPQNEVFLDVVEKLNVLVASNGTVLSSEILGCIKIKSYLSGLWTVLQACAYSPALGALTPRRAAVHVLRNVQACRN
jgi:hypothetical protein